MSKTETSEGSMKALHYDGPFKVSIKEIPKPKLQHPDDVIVKVTTSCKQIPHNGGSGHSRIVHNVYNANADLQAFADLSKLALVFLREGHLTNNLS